MTTQKQIRAAFWHAFPNFQRRPGKTQNDYPATVRSAFVDWMNYLRASEQITEALANRATL
jgi:hypothetical protein